MSNISKRRAAQLGMPLGTAANRLRKALLFKYIQRAEEDICWRCGQIINSADTLSIDHVVRWFNSEDPVGLFFDLENVRFSHCGCNSGAGPHSKLQRKVGPEGTAWCSNCQDFLPVDSFHKQSNRWNGLKDYCKECRRKLKV
jgi:hypothetical protein